MTRNEIIRRQCLKKRTKCVWVFDHQGAVSYMLARIYLKPKAVQILAHIKNCSSAESAFNLHKSSCIEIEACTHEQYHTTQKLMFPSSIPPFSHKKKMHHWTFAAWILQNLVSSAAKNVTKKHASSYEGTHTNKYWNNNTVRKSKTTSKVMWKSTENDRECGVI